MIHTLYILDEGGNPVPVDVADPNAVDWGKWRYTHHKQCVIALDRVRDASAVQHYVISTVFTGINAGNDPPLLWETVILHAGDGEYQPYASYASRVDAEVGHQRALAYYRDQLTQTQTTKPEDS